MSLLANLLLLASLCHVAVVAYPNCYQFWKVNLSSGKEVYGYSNFGNCTCKQAREDELPHKDLCIFVPECKDDGAFVSRQTDFHNVFCVDKNGNQNTETVITLDPSEVQCKP